MTDRQTDRQTEHELTGYPSIDRPWLKYYSKESINGSIPTGSLYDYAYQQNKDRLDKTLIDYYGRNITGRVFFDNVHKAMNAFLEKGIMKGDAVTLISLVTPETLYTIYALNQLGALINSVYLSLSEEELIETVKATKSKMIVAIEKVGERINVVTEKTGLECIVLSIGDSLPLGKKFLYRLKKKEYTPTSKIIEFSDFIEGKGSVIPPSEEKSNRGDEPAFIMYTSGTTGLPKGAVLTNYAINSIAWQYLHMMEHGENDSFMGFIPPFFSIGFSLGTHMPLVMGLKYEICVDPTPDAVSRTYCKIHPNHFVGAPSNVLQIADMLKGDLSYIKTLATGGASCTLEQERSISEKLKKGGSEAKFITGYGMTEFSATVATLRNDVYREGSIGIPLPKANVKVVDPEAYEELKYHETGELWFTAPGNMLEYYNAPDETAKTVVTDADGISWIKTGDLGEIDEDGFVIFKGRLKRIYLKQGEDGTLYKIFPQRLEQVISGHERVKNCAVVVLDDEKKVHVQVAFVACDKIGEDNTSFINALIPYCKDSLPEHMLPDNIMVVDDFPYKENGKMDYSVLEKMATEIMTKQQRREAL